MEDVCLVNIIIVKVPIGMTACGYAYDIYYGDGLTIDTNFIGKERYNDIKTF